MPEAFFAGLSAELLPPSPPSFAMSHKLNTGNSPWKVNAVVANDVLKDAAAGVDN
jgi:hypothetical protein